MRGRWALFMILILQIMKPRMRRDKDTESGSKEGVEAERDFYNCMIIFAPKHIITEQIDFTEQSW